MFLLLNNFAYAILLVASLSFRIGMAAAIKRSNTGLSRPPVGRTAAVPTRNAGMYGSNKRIDARFSHNDFVPDGDLSKKIWRDAKWIEFEGDMSGRRAYPEARTKVAAVWTSSHVYFAFWCKYTKLNIYEGENSLAERWELWNRDVIEVFLNPEPDHLNHYFEFEIAPNNQWVDLEIDKSKTPFNDAAWNSGFEHATHLDP